MDTSVEDTIARMRALFSVENDAELARALRIDKSTVSSWKSRGRVPERFSRLLNEDPTSLFPDGLSREMVSELAMPAQPIAIFRFSLMLNDPSGQLANPEKKLAFLTHELAFHSVMIRAALDLWERKSALNVKPEVAALLVLQDDIRDEEATLVRARSQLAEDMMHNPSAARILA